jgi:ribosomal protein S18
MQLKDIITDLRTLELYIHAYNRILPKETTEKEVKNLQNCDQAIKQATEAIRRNLENTNRATNHKRKI